MATTMTLSVILIGSFLLLRSIREISLSSNFPLWGITLCGLLAWVFVLSTISMPLWIVYLVYDLLGNKNLNQIYLLLFIGVVGGMLFQAKEMLDSPQVWDFARTAIWFRPYTVRTLRLDDELEKKRIKEIHRTTTGKTAVDLPSEVKFRTEDEIRKLQEEARAAAGRGLQPAGLKEDLLELQSERPVDLSDTWKINSFRKSSHAWYGTTLEVRIDPGRATIAFRLNLPEIRRDQLREANALFSFKQDVYALLQAIHTEEWLKPYASFFSTIELTCIGIETDGFGQTALLPFFRISARTSELAKREGKFFAATELHTISTISFNNGDSIE
ncbi:MAG: hypothetical protein WD182_02495 [Bacteroidota bacterium]